MILYPPAKINMGLSIIEKRPDGFHNIETVFYPIPLCDRLIVETIDKNSNQKLEFTCDGLEIPVNEPCNNLCCKAYHLLDADDQLPPTKIHLRKAIPAGAGLGGGSSDAAYTLLALNELYQLRLSFEDLTSYASQIGSDCSFFLLGKPAFGSGKGDILTPVNLSLAGYHLLLVKPPVFVSTAEAYSSATPKKALNHLPEALQAPISEWRYTVFNDFEAPVFSKFPETGRIKERLYREGAVYAAMSGSGSCIYGIFEQERTDLLKSFPDCFVWTGKMT